MQLQLRSGRGAGSVSVSSMDLVGLGVAYVEAQAAGIGTTAVGVTVYHWYSDSPSNLPACSTHIVPREYPGVRCRPFTARCNAAALSPPVATLPPFGFVRNDSCEPIGLMIDSAKVRCSADAIYSAM